MTNNKVAMCSCPRECRHLSYKYDISQAMLSNQFVKATMNFLSSNVTADEFRFDYCFLEVVPLCDMFPLQFYVAEQQTVHIQTLVSVPSL